MNWVRTYDRDGEYLEHRDGIDWYHAPLPRRWHRCTPQSRGWFKDHAVLRCACGAIATSDCGLFWMERNSRRATQRRQTR